MPFSRTDPSTPSTPNAERCNNTDGEDTASLLKTPAASRSGEEGATPPSGTSTATTISSDTSSRKTASPSTDDSAAQVEVKEEDSSNVARLAVPDERAASIPAVQASSTESESLSEKEEDSSVEGANFWLSVGQGIAAVTTGAAVILSGGGFAAAALMLGTSLGGMGAVAQMQSLEKCEKSFQTLTDKLYDMNDEEVERFRSDPRVQAVVDNMIEGMSENSRREIQEYRESTKEQQQEFLEKCIEELFKDMSSENREYVERKVKMRRDRLLREKQGLLGNVSS